MSERPKMGFIVIRDPDEPIIDGRWYDVDAPGPICIPLLDGRGLGQRTYRPTADFEVRDVDGAVAQVYR